MATVYGDNKIFETCRTAIDTLLDSLKTAMDGASTDPRFTAVYNRHEILKASLYAVSVDIDSITDDGEGRAIGIKAEVAGSRVNARYPAILSVRVHTDYIGGYLDRIVVAQLLNSVNNYLQTHRQFTAIDDTGVNFLITEFGDISFVEEFSESLTIGGEMSVGVVVHVEHLQA